MLTLPLRVVLPYNRKEIIMYQIGEFSYLAETTIKTIRYYDKIGLLKPKKIDEFTKYRYYDEYQIEIIKKF